MCRSDIFQSLNHHAFHSLFILSWVPCHMAHYMETFLGAIHSLTVQTNNKMYIFNLLNYCFLYAGVTFFSVKMQILMTMKARHRGRREIAEDQNMVRGQNKVCQAERSTGSPGGADEAGVRRKAEAAVTVTEQSIGRGLDC